MLGVLPKIGFAFGVASGVVGAGSSADSAGAEGKDAELDAAAVDACCLVGSDVGSVDDAGLEGVADGAGCWAFMEAKSKSTFVIGLAVWTSRLAFGLDGGVPTQYVGYGRVGTIKP